MRKIVTISNFGGIAPRFGNNLKPGYSKSAVDCDLSSGKIEPFNGHSLVQADTTMSNSIFYHEGVWHVGNDRHYLSWPISGNNLLIFLDGGVLYKTVNSVTAPCGQTAPSAPTVANATTRLTLSDPAIYEWKESENGEDEYYCVLRNSIDNITLETCDSIGTWSDDDSGSGAQSTQATYDSRETFKFDSGDAGSLARRTRDLGELPEIFRVALRLRHHTVGNLADTDFFQLDVRRSDVALSVRFALDGLFVYNGSSWTEIGTNAVDSGAWIDWVFVVDATTAASTTCEIYKNGTLVDDDVDCSYTGSYTDGECVLTQYGSTTANRIAYVDHLYVGNPGDPSLTQPDRIQIDSEPATEGTAGSLNSDEWDYDDNDNLGFSTIYAKIPPYPEESYEWVASGTGTNEYYLRKYGGGDPEIGTSVKSVKIDGKNYAQSVVGSLTAKQWGLGDTDSLGFTTLYIEMFDSTDPSVGVHKVKIRRGILEPEEVNLNVDQAGALKIKTGVESWLEILHEINHGNITSSAVRYVITTTRNVGGHTDESGPSAVSDEVECNDEGDAVTVTAPAISDPLVTHWNIYRLDTDSAQFLFHSSNLVSVASIEDDLATADLGPALTTEYESDQGNTITFAPPLSGLDGIATDLYAGMVFTWKDNTLYWCEPGFPDAWPVYYSIDFPSDIKRVIPLTAAVGVLCADGPMRVDGTHPEQLQQSDVLGEEPCVSTAACKTSSGIAYFSDSGIVNFNLVSTQVITDSQFTERWFSDNVDPDSAILTENDGIIYLFHSGGILVCDARTRSTIFYTSPTIVYAAYKRPDNGALYILDSEGIKQFGAGVDTLTWTWQSGDLIGVSPGGKEWMTCEVEGSGDVSISLYLDGILLATKALDFSTLMDRDKRLKFPENSNGRAAQILLTGTGSVTEAILEYSL